MIEHIECLFLYRIEEGDDYEIAEREMGMAAIVLLAVFDEELDREACAALTLEEDLVVKDLLGREEELD